MVRGDSRGPDTPAARVVKSPSNARLVGCVDPLTDVRTGIWWKCTLYSTVPPLCGGEGGESVPDWIQYLLWKVLVPPTNGSSHSRPLNTATCERLTSPESALVRRTCDARRSRVVLFNAHRASTVCRRCRSERVMSSTRLFFGLTAM